MGCLFLDLSGVKLQKKSILTRSKNSWNTSRRNITLIYTRKINVVKKTFENSYPKFNSGILQPYSIGEVTIHI